MRARQTVLLTVLLALLLTACGGSNNNGKAAAPAASPASSGTQPAAGSPQARSTAAPQPAAASSAVKPARGGTLTVAIDSNMKNLDPLKSTLLVDRQIHYQLYDSLVQIGPDLTIQPDLADSWDTSDPKAIVFKLHQGVKFQDGTDFDATAVKFNIDRILNTASSPRHSEIAS